MKKLQLLGIASLVTGSAAFAQLQNRYSVELQPEPPQRAPSVGHEPMHLTEQQRVELRRQLADFSRSPRKISSPACAAAAPCPSPK